MKLDILIRPVDAVADQAFLFDLFRAVRAARFDFHPGGHPQMAVMIRQQFEALERALAAAHTSADHSLILAAGQPAGRLMVARPATAVHLADISLLPERQRQGIGSLVVKRILEEAQTAQLPVRCTVQQNNPGGYLFFRAMGFQITAQDTAYVHLEWLPV